MEVSVPALKKLRRLPRHIGIIPDGNRRWAQLHGMPKEAGYQYGIDPGFELFRDCKELGIEEMTFYGFTQDNTKRPAEQRVAFQKACVDAVMRLANDDGALLVVGNTQSKLFPPELKPFTKRVMFGDSKMKVNFLVNYGWQWDLASAFNNIIKGKMSTKNIGISIASKDISRVDLIIRWGGRRRLSGFLPVQSIYADFYVLDDLWPDYRKEHLERALDWYEEQDITLGG